MYFCICACALCWWHIDTWLAPVCDFVFLYMCYVFLYLCLCTVCMLVTHGWPLCVTAADGRIAPGLHLPTDWAAFVLPLFSTHKYAIHKYAIHKCAIHKYAVHKKAITKYAINKYAIHKKAITKNTIHKYAIKKNQIHKYAIHKYAIHKYAPHKNMHCTSMQPSPPNRLSICLPIFNVPSYKVCGAKVTCKEKFYGHMVSVKEKQSF